MTKIKNQQIIISSNFDFNNNRLINLSNPLNDTDATTKLYVDNSSIISGGTITGDVILLGDLYVSGVTTTIDVGNLNVRDNIILLNSGETSDHITLIYSGIEIDRGSGTRCRLVFNDDVDAFQVGFVGSLQSVATREDSPTSSGVSYWNSTLNRLDTSSNLIFDNNTLKYGTAITLVNDVDIVHKKYVDDLVDNISMSLSGLSDTTITSIQIGDGIIYSGGTWINKPVVTSIIAGSGMSFSNITSTGLITLGTPSPITSTSTDSVTSTTHTHSIDSSSLVSGTEGILVNNDNQFILDSTYVIDSIIPGLTRVTGVTSNTNLGTISSGITLGMVYIQNTGNTNASVNLGITTTGNEINPYGEILILSGETISITVNKRLSNTQTEHIYISSSDWTNVELIVEWAEITYKNQSNEIDPSALPIATEFTLGGVKIGNNINAAGDGTISVDDPIVSLSGLTDTDINSPVNDQVLKYSDGTWVNGDAVTFLSGLTDTNINTPQESQILVYSGGTWVNSDPGGSGGFLGTVTKDSAEPSELFENQWVQPEPQSDGTFSYTFDNFSDASSTPINVNLSLEDVKLRYHASGYWVKESFNRPLSSGKTWIGTTNNEVQEVSVIEEWVTTESGLTYIGQKFAYDTQTIFKTDFDKLTTLQNFILIEDINLKSVANTAIVTIPSGKRMLFNRIKLIILADATPTSFTISVGNNASTYNNIVGATTIDDVILNETYDLAIGTTTYPRQSTALTSGTVYFRVSSASTNENALTAHLLVEGYVF